MKVAEQTATKSRRETIIDWYQEVFPAAARYIHRRGGDLDTAREIFQEAIVCYYEKLSNKDFTPEVSDLAYLMGMVKNLWLKNFDRVRRFENLDEVEISVDNPRQLLTNKLMRFLEHSGKKCMNLLQSFYYEKLNMIQVADRFGYSSTRSATVGKYKCLEKVRNEIKNKSLSYEDFID